MNMSDRNWTIVALSCTMVPRKGSGLPVTCDHVMNSPVVPCWDQWGIRDMIDWYRRNNQYKSFAYHLSVPFTKKIIHKCEAHVHFLIMSNRTVRIFKLVDQTTRLQLIQSVRKDQFPTDYAYVTGAYSDQPPRIFKTESEAFLYARECGYNPIMVSKFALRWFGKPGANYGEPFTPNVQILYDRANNIPTDDPQKMYDYLMRIVGCELIEYNIEGDRTSSWWILGEYIPKGYSDFMVPEYFRDMVERFKPPACPIWWSHLHEIDNVINYGNVLTGDNITRMRSETNNA